MKTLTIFYDGECGLCRRLKERFERMPARERLEFLPYQSAAAAAEARVPGINDRRPESGMLVRTPEGTLLEGGDSWLRLVAATRRFGGVARILGWPGFRGIVRAGYGWVAARRRSISRWLGWTAGDPGCSCRSLPEGGPR